MITQEHVNKYIDSKSLSWSPSTLKSERARLVRALPNLSASLAPEELYKLLKNSGNYGDYTIKTTFIRIRQFLKEVSLTEPDESAAHQLYESYDRFVTTHQRLFKYAYNKERLNITFNEALKRVQTIKNLETRAKAIQLLTSGMRFTESITLQNSEVVGKGGKRRIVYGAAELTNEVSYKTLYTALKKIGLKPHTLRKLAAQRLIEKGADISELMEIMGWSDITTAGIYLQSARRKDRIKDLMSGIV